MKFQKILEDILTESKNLTTRQAREISASWASGSDAIQVFTTYGAKVRSEDHRKQLIDMIFKLIKKAVFLISLSIFITE